MVAELSWFAGLLKLDVFCNGYLPPQVAKRRPLIPHLVGFPPLTHLAVGVQVGLSRRPPISAHDDVSWK